MRTSTRVTGIVIRDSKLLLIHRCKQGVEYYVFPGGGVEAGETWDEALARELLEETGLHLLDFRCLYQTQEGPVQFIFYECSLSSGEPKLGGPELAAQSDDNQYCFEWVAANRLADLPGLYPKPGEACLRDLIYNHST